MEVINGLRQISKFEDILVHDSKAPRRSSVALIIRFPRLPSTTTGSLDDILDAAEALENSGQTSGQSFPQILFIKRAASKRDRWSNHIALPGGRRDVQDKSDVDTAIRETWEEVGIDLKSNAVYIGPLDQRLVKVSWATKTIMTLCSHVFVLTDPEVKLTIQPTEVADAFWHPVSELFKPSYWGREYVHLGKRLGLENSWIFPRCTHWVINKLVGDMYFGAIDLWRSDVEAGTPPEKLWGLTLGIIVDLLEVCQPGSVVSLVEPPQMVHWDTRLVTRLLSVRQTAKSKKLINEMKNRGSYTAGSLDIGHKLIHGHFRYLFPSIIVSLVMRLAGLLLLIRYLRSRRVKFTRR
jgi:8-oxo-dGTP pyrophosphatase MutT (NUDIX family)